MAAILDLPLTTVISYLKHAIEKEKEDAAWDAWISLLPQMYTGEIKFISFEDFKREFFKPKVRHTKKTNEEIEEEIREIVEQYEKNKMEVLPLPKVRFSQ